MRCQWWLQRTRVCSQQVYLTRSQGYRLQHASSQSVMHEEQGSHPSRLCRLTASSAVGLAILLNPVEEAASICIANIAAVDIQAALRHVLRQKIDKNWSGGRQARTHAGGMQKMGRRRRESQNSALQAHSCSGPANTRCIAALTVAAEPSSRNCAAGAAIAAALR